MVLELSVRDSVRKQTNALSKQIKKKKRKEKKNMLDEVVG